MRTITCHTASKDLQNVISSTLNNQEETIIVTNKGSVVMIDKQNWESITETLRLFRDKKSLKALLEGHRVRFKSENPKGKSVKEVFNDL